MERAQQWVKNSCPAAEQSSAQRGALAGALAGVPRRSCSELVRRSRRTKATGAIAGNSSTLSNTFAGPWIVSTPAIVSINSQPSKPYLGPLQFAEPMFKTLFRSALTVRFMCCHERKTHTQAKGWKVGITCVDWDMCKEICINARVIFQWCLTLFHIFWC